MNWKGKYYILNSFTKKKNVKKERQASINSERQREAFSAKILNILRPHIIGPSQEELLYSITAINKIAIAW